MTRVEPAWDLYRSFLAVLEHGTVSAAARALGLAQPTLGRHIDALEEALGLTLFVRSRHGFLPTDQAAGLRPYAEAVAASAAALWRATSGNHEARGTVRVTASEVVGVEVLPPILARLYARYPHIQIELVLSNRTHDLLQREADIAIRMVQPTQDALIARHVGHVQAGLHAHRRYLEQRGTPTTAAELANHLLIGFDTESAFLRGLRAQLAPLRRDMFSLRTDSDLAQLAAIRAGAGIGICQVGIAQRSADLERVLPELATFRLDTWVVMHENLRDSQPCASVFALLAEELRAYLQGD